MVSGARLPVTFGPGKRLRAGGSGRHCGPSVWGSGAWSGGVIGVAGGRPVAQGRGRCLFWRRPGGLVACPLLAGWPVGVVAWGLLAWGPGGPVACPSVGRLAWWPGGLLAFLAWWPGGLVAWLFPAYTSQHFVLFCPPASPSTVGGGLSNQSAHTINCCGNFLLCLWLFLPELASSADRNFR